VYLCHQVDNQAIVVPDNIDAVCCLMHVCDGPTSIRRTNAALGVARWSTPETSE